MCLIRMIYVLIYHGPSPPQLPYVLFLCVALLHLVFPIPLLIPWSAVRTSQ